MAGDNPFDRWAEAYEALIDWPKRLAYEEPFFRQQFQACKAHRVLDAACGSGRHAEMFSTWGIDVTAMDLSPAMIAAAQARCGESPRLHWRVGDVRRPIEALGTFDAIVCLGNSLALLAHSSEVLESLRALRTALRSGGRLIVHVLNLFRFHDGPPYWQKCVRTRLSYGERLLIKGVQRCGTRGFVHLTAVSTDSPPKLESDCSELLVLSAEQWCELFREAGLAEIGVFGDHENHPFAAESSPDIILVGVKE